MHSANPLFISEFERKLISAIIPPEVLAETADDSESRFVSCNLDFDHWRR